MNLGKAIIVSVMACGLFWPGLPTSADPHSGMSANVAFIGGSTLDTNVPCGYSGFTAANVMYVSGGGCLPVSGPVGELGDFTFEPMVPADVSAANLALYDTAVLNVASWAMNCDTNNLSAQAKADLVDFVGNGNKLIIYDSECYPGPVDYTWLPFPFTTANPGALGASGTLTVVENNLLSTWVGDPDCTGAGALDPHCINVAYLGSSTDAVGDMNVVTTVDPNLCADLSGTNAIGVTGATHVYMKYPTASGVGLIFYNGLDMDYLYYDDTELRQLWVQELQQPLDDPASLPCGTPVVGISLTPPTAENEVGTDHTVTAALSDLLNNPQPDELVNFEVTSGPNAGAAGTCSVNTDCTTDENGEVSFTYNGSGGEGIDEIVACFFNEVGSEICSQRVTKEWIILNAAPECDEAYPSQALLWPPNHRFEAIEILGVLDPDEEPVSITITGIRQDEPVTAQGTGTTAPDGRGVGTSIAEVRRERMGSDGENTRAGNGRVYHIEFLAEDPQGASCSGEVLVGVPHDQNPVPDPIDDGPIYDSTEE